MDPSQALAMFPPPNGQRQQPFHPGNGFVEASPNWAPQQQQQQQQQQQPRQQEQKRNTDSSHYDTVERILSQAEHRQDENQGGQGPLSPTEIDKLSRLCTVQVQPSATSLEEDLGFSDVDPDMMAQLVDLLEKHVTLASSVDVIKEGGKIIKEKRQTVDQWLQNDGFDLITTLKLGMEAAGALLFIITSPGIDQRVVNEDAIEASIVLFRHNIAKNILPALNNIGHMIVGATADASNPPSAKKRRRSSSGGEAVIIREMKKIYKQILSTVGLTIVVMERLEALVQKIPLDDQQALNLSSGALMSLELDPYTDAGIKDAHLLHVATIGVVTSIFRKYPRHRSIIVEDLFPIMLKMPSTKKSLRTFPVQCSSILYPAGLQSLSMSLVPSNQDAQSIQTMSAVILTFVQSAVVRPTYETVHPPADDNAMQVEGQSQDQGQVRFMSGLLSCQQLCDMFIMHLLQRCAKKGEDGGASEFRPILSNLIDDLLLILLVPEYPAAEMMLLSIANGLSLDLIKASSSNRALQAAEATYLNTAFDALGKIGAAEARIRASHRDTPLKLKVSTRKIEDKTVRCYCQKNLHPDTLVLDCDQCHTWYHAPCVDLARGNVPEKWFCDTCQLQRIVGFERDRNTNVGELGFSAAAIDEPYCMRRLLVDYLSIVSKQNAAAGIRDSYEFHLARWVGEVDPTGKKTAEGQPPLDPANMPPLVARLMELWDPSESYGMDVASRGSQSLNGMLQCMSDQGRSRMMLHLAATQSPLLQSFKSQVELIVKLMSSETGSSLRKLAVKAIEKVTDADPKLMLFVLVKNAVTARFSDEAISVREAAVSLVGTYVVHSPAVANAFHSAFLTGLKDTGVSVRKRTVKILQDILCSNSSYKGRASACSEMLRLAADPKEDDGVRDLIHDLFMKLWLENGDERVEQEVAISPTAQTPNGLMSPSKVLDVEELQMHGANAGLVTPTPPQRFPAGATSSATSTRSLSRKIQTTMMRQRSEIASEQMVEVVKAANTGDNLTSLLRELLSGVADADKDRKASERRKRKVIAQSHCAMLVDSLFEILLSVEERKSKLAENFGRELVSTIRTIRVFTDVSPPVVLRHLDTLLPYLKADNGVTSEQDAAIVGAICDILTRLSLVFDAELVKKLGTGSLGDDLERITYKFGRSALSSAVRALCSLAHHKDAGEESPFRKKLLKLATTFYNLLLKYLDNDDLGMMKIKARTNIQRALTVLGAICRHHETPFEDVESDEENEDGEPAGPIQLTWTNLPALCERLFTKFLEKSHVETKCSALRALSGMFVAHPRELFAMDQSGLITQVMSAESHPSLQLESLRCWRDILLAEEARIESGEAKAKMDANKGITLAKRIAGDQDGDATLFGGVLTSHASRLFEMTQCRDKNLRFAALDLVGHLLRQGQVNPNEAVPFLLALQGDVDEDDIRSLALKLLMIEGEKRPDMLRQRVCAGVKQAYVFQSTVYPDKPEVSALVRVARHGNASFECVFGSVFRECIISITKQRHGLFRNLLGLFNMKDRAGSLETKTRKSKSSMNEMGAVKLPLLSFAAQVLAHLPYNVASDPLYIIHHISSTVALQGADLLDRLSSLLRPYGLSSNDEYDESNTGEDDLERAATRNIPTHAKEATPLLQPNFDSKGFAELCGEAAAITLLLRLKTFLRRAYNLTESRILGYDPEAKERVADKCVKSSAPIFQSSIPMKTFSSKAKDIDMDALILQYSEFRKSMRTEVETRYSDSEDETQTPSKNKRSRRAEDDDDDEEED